MKRLLFAAVALAAIACGKPDPLVGTYSGSTDIVPKKVMAVASQKGKAAEGQQLIEDSKIGGGLHQKLELNADHTFYMGDPDKKFFGSTGNWKHDGDSLVLTPTAGTMGGKPLTGNMAKGFLKTLTLHVNGAALVIGGPGVGLKFEKVSQ